MNKTRLSGVILCGLSLALVGLFLWGIIIGEPWSYWAIAVPVILALVGLAALAFWVGWTMATAKAEAPRPQAEEETAPEETGDNSS